MDVAKIACVSIPAQQKGIEISDLLLDNKLFTRFIAIECFQVPTTAGTGSEVTPFATVWDYTNQKKKSFFEIRNGRRDKTRLARAKKSGRAAYSKTPRNKNGIRNQSLDKT